MNHVLPLLKGASTDSLEAAYVQAAHSGHQHVVKAMTDTVTRHCGMKTKFRALIAAASSESISCVHYLNEIIATECERDFSSYRDVAKDYPDIIESLEGALKKAGKHGQSDIVRILMEFTSLLRSGAPTGRCAEPE